VNVSKYDDRVLGARSGPDVETPPPPLGLDAFDPIDEDDELVEDLRTVRMRVPHRRTIPSDIPEPGASFGAVAASEDSEGGLDRDAEPGLDTEPTGRPASPVHEVSPPARERPASIVERAVRPKSALDAARDAAEQEAAGPGSSAPPRAPKGAGGDAVRAAIARDLGGAGQIFVLETHEVSAGPLAQARSGALDREILRALWRGHRAKFLADGNLERAATAAVVVQALEQRAPLAVARVVARGRDHLAFVDVDSRRVIACLADAYALATAASARAPKA
jgi:hypothetical protein